MTARNKGGFSQAAIERYIRPCATAGFFVLVAFFLTLPLQRFFPYPFLFLFFGAVMGSAWFGGAIAGFVSVALSTLVVDYFFVPPVFSISIGQMSQTYVIAFIVCAMAISWVSSTRKRAETEIRDARDRLEQRVLERTAELLRSNLEIQESEHRLRLLTEAIPQQIWSANADGQIEYCNQQLLEFTGCTADELRGETFFRIIHPEDEQLFRESWKNAVESGNKLEGEWRVRGGDGVFRWFIIRGVPQKGTEGGASRWYGTHIDTEERRQAEQALVRAQTELSHLSHTLSLGELAASIAHELGQPLTAVTTNAYACQEWLHAKPANLEKATSTAMKIVQESQRASAVVARVRALFRKEPHSKDLIDVNRVIHDLARLLRDDAIRRGISIQVQLDPNLPQTEVDPIQIEQVLMNLATNGMDAMSSQRSSRELFIRSSLNGAHELLVQVEDCGVGISPDVAARIFDPFFSTKPEGLGLGLSISRTIIEAHDGRLWAAPRPSGGMTFQFTLPVRR
jgi:PAS domain S-box-containing protein